MSSRSSSSHAVPPTDADEPAQQTPKGKRIKDKARQTKPPAANDAGKARAKSEKVVGAEMAALIRHVGASAQALERTTPKFKEMKDDKVLNKKGTARKAGPSAFGR